MKKIGIDARLLQESGVGIYIKNLLHFLDLVDTSDFKFYIYLNQEGFANLDFLSKNFIKKKAYFRWHSINEQIGFLKTIRDDKLDLMHFTYFSYPVSYAGRFVVTVHDLIPYLYKTGRASTKNKFIFNFKHMIYKWLITNAIMESTAIITPSNSVKEEMLNLFTKSVEDKIHVLYEGVDYEIAKLKPDDSLRNLLKYPYLLYVGNFYPHKNVENLIKAFSKSRKKIHLILAGPDDFFAKRIQKMIDRLKQNKRIMLLTNLKRAQTLYLYKKASALIHPTLAEGFGLTLVEAAYCKLPIIASDIPVFKEIFGDNYLKFDPSDVDDISKKINLFFDKKPRYNYTSTLKKLSFQKMAADTFKLYKTIV